jgi:hypothetical protein
MRLGLVASFQMEAVTVLFTRDSGGADALPPTY